MATGGEDIILDEPANPRKHDCMAAIEYLAAHVLPLVHMGIAHVEPSRYANRGSPAYRHAQKLLAKNRQQQDTMDSYVHLGPGHDAA